MKKILLVILMILISSCSSKNEEFKEIYTDKQLYEMGTENYDRREYKKSVTYFSRLTQEYPYSTFASQSQFMEGMGYFRAGEFDDAMIAFDEFISLYPADSNIDYVYYMKALSKYDQITEIRLDQSITVEAGNSLKELINRFPNSKYAKDAKQKLFLVDDHLAGKEMENGRFYLKKKDIISAIGRFQTVVDNYQTTSHIQEALYRLVETYYALGVIEEAKRNAAVLGNNYPTSKWYKYSYDLLNSENAS